MLGVIPYIELLHDLKKQQKNANKPFYILHHFHGSNIYLTVMIVTCIAGSNPLLTASALCEVGM